jgi:hypothetical protein
VTFTTGISENNGGILQQLYPNPAENLLNVVFNSSEAAIITVTDVAGRTVLSKQLSGNSRAELEVGALEAGVYMVVLQDKAGAQLGSARFVKQ